VHIPPIDIDSWLFYLGPPEEEGVNDDKTVAIIVGSVIGGLVLISVTAAVLFFVIKYRVRILNYFGVKGEYEVV